MKWFSFAVVCTCLVILIGCGPGPNNQTNIVAGDGEIANFWHGIFHGYIAVATWTISLFYDKVSIYEIHNSGVWYNLGYLLGIGAFGGSYSVAKTRKQKKSED